MPVYRAATGGWGLGVSFFEPRPPQPDMSVEQPTGRAPHLWDRPSEAIMGAPVGISALVARSDRLAVALGTSVLVVPAAAPRVR